MTAATYPSTYNVVYDRISLSVNPGTSAAITSGSVTTWFKTTAASLSQIGFDLDQAMTVSSITYHGTSLSTTQYSHAANILLITFPSAIAVLGTLDSVTINYSGTPVTPTTSIPSGYNRASVSGGYIIYTLSEAFTAHDWWPCKDSLVDKIDSVDMIVTAPSTYKVGGNGVVTTSTSGTNTISWWKTRYPIATYLINFSVGPYVDYEFNVTTGLTTTVSLPVHNYLFSSDNTSATQSTLGVISSLIPDYASLLNTDYPFINEKYGTAECANFGGALEVQSMTFVSQGAYTASILAHELSHQWFGDRLTTDSWHMIWLNEGFAEYFQYFIYPELLLNAVSALSNRQSVKTAVTNSSTTYVSNIANVDDIFIPSSTVAQPYEKGAMTVSMLRTWLGDTKFFNALHNYLNAPGLAYNFTDVDSLEYYMEAQVQPLGFDLTNFFSEWVNNPGRVTYAVQYQYVTNGIYLTLTQSPTSAGQGHFDIPIPIEIKGSNGLDTTVVIIDKGTALYNSATGADMGYIAHYTLSGTPTNLYFDPNSLVLATASSTTAITTLPILDIALSANPDNGHTQLNWEITTDEQLQTLVLERSTDGQHFVSIDSQQPIRTADNQYDGGYLDASPEEGTVFYRLKVANSEGAVTYSSIITVNVQNTTAFTIAPNPVENSFTVEIPLNFGDNNNVSLIIYDGSGRMIKNTQVSGTSAAVSCQEFPGGVYALLLVNDKRKKLYMTFIKK